MSKEVIIDVKDLHVSFLVQPKGIRSVKKLIFSLGTGKLFERKDVLKGLDIQVYRGECLGILGRNGSGKSTLLRAISGIVPPEKGTIEVKGRIAPMLALGVGLETELSGNDNITLLATLMGFSRKEIEASRDSIIEFSGLNENVGMQVKRFSSGMAARLAFSIAVANNPEVLIVDEALAVGDAGFQKKCFAKIDELRKNGTTIIYVSHQVSEIEQMCDRAAFLKKGTIEYIGEPKEAIFRYMAEFNNEGVSKK